MSQNPAFSIISINLNNKKGLKSTINSVVSQIFQNYEYIVIDGGSEDGSLEVIRQFENKIDFWISEKDTGIYNAMNKGITKANGNFLLFLNSGDSLHNENVLNDAFKMITSDDQICTGDMLLNFESKQEKVINPEHISLNDLYYKTISHQATFINAKLFKKYGLYNENLKIVSDWEFFFKVLILKNEPYKKIPLLISIFDTSGISYNPNYQNALQKEAEFAMSYLVPQEKIRESLEQYDILQKKLNESKRFAMLEKIEQSIFLRRMLSVFMRMLLFLQKRGLKHSKKPL